MEGEAKCTVEEMVNRINNKITSPQIKKKKKSQNPHPSKYCLSEILQSVENLRAFV
jgi:predicted secreted Zn-dependent protease